MISSWGAALTICVLPLGLALDFGGILRWTQYVAALAVTVAGVLALIHLLTRSEQFGVNGWQTPIRGHFLAMLLLGWGAFAWCQTIPIPAGLLAWISSGAHSAYVDWAGPLVGEEIKSASISIASVDSRHAVSVLVIATLVSWVSAVVFNSRGRITTLLLSVAIAGAAIGAIGMFRLVDPGFRLWSFTESSNPFSTFVNRNNAACFLNLGLTAAFALVAWRWKAASVGSRLNRHRIREEFSTLISDWLFVVSVCCASISIMSLVLCGSRGGMISILTGGIFVCVACGERIKSSLLVGATLVVGSVAALTAIPSTHLPGTISRLQAFLRLDEPFANDARLRHLPDGLTAAMAYLPFGSGLSTYSYAYLPYQSDYPSSWFHHADNLWLEVFVEQGFVGVVLSFGILGLLVSSLRRLANSHDSADLGLRVAGWYMVGFILVSQFFDYGLIMPANLFAAVSFGAVVVSRSQQISPKPTNSKARSKTSTSTKVRVEFVEKRTVMPVSLGIGLVVLSGAATVVLSGEARAESVSHSVVQIQKFVRADQTRVDDSLAMVRAANNAHSNPKLLAVIADLEFQSARYRETIDSNFLSLIEMERFFKAASPDSRRLAWRKQLAEQPNKTEPTGQASTSVYSDALNTHLRLLLNRPLALEPRIGIVRLEFLHQDLERSDRAIEQIGLLYRNSFAVTRQLALLAAEGGDRSAAIELYRRAIELRPRQADQIAVSAWDAGSIRTFEIMPAEPIRRIEASIALLNRSKIDSETFDWIRAENRATEFATPAENAMQQLLSGQIEVRLGNTAQAIEYFKNAVRAAPELIETHVFLIRAYLNVGEIELAEEQTAEALFYHPKDSRLTTLIDSVSPDRKFQAVDSIE